MRTDEDRSFVVADIPGLIEGAAEGAGLGHQFLRHLQRTRLLLHLVDIAPLDPEADPVQDARAIVKELQHYDAALYEKPRWLVLNKLDLVPEDERAARVKAFVKAFGWKGPVFAIAAINGEGCRELVCAAAGLARRASGGAAARAGRRRRIRRRTGRRSGRRRGDARHRRRRPAPTLRRRRALP